jgi:hypothetical protein
LACSQVESSSNNRQNKLSHRTQWRGFSEARPRSLVEAWPLSLAEAWLLSLAEAWLLSTVEAWLLSTVEAWPLSTDEAWPVPNLSLTCRQVVPSSNISLKTNFFTNFLASWIIPSPPNNG